MKLFAKLIMILLLLLNLSWVFQCPVCGLSIVYRGIKYTATGECVQVYECINGHIVYESCN